MNKEKHIIQMKSSVARFQVKLASISSAANRIEKKLDNFIKTK